MMIERIIYKFVDDLGEYNNYGRGLLMIKSYYSFNHIVISIQNNGPEIYLCLNFLYKN